MEPFLSSLSTASWAQPTFRPGGLSKSVETNFRAKVALVTLVMGISLPQRQRSFKQDHNHKLFSTEGISSPSGNPEAEVSAESRQGLTLGSQT